MRETADVIITVRRDGGRGGSDVSGWLELQSFYLDSKGVWTAQAECGCVATQASWRRCASHRRLRLLCIQSRLPFRIADS